MPVPAFFAALAALSFALLSAAAGAEQGDAAAASPADFAPRLGWGAELEFELSAAGSDAEQPDPHFQIDQLYLYPELELMPDVLLHAEIAVKGDGTIIEEAWARWTAGERFWVKAGLEDPVIAQVDRVTEAEILLETAFYRSDEMGVQVGGAAGKGVQWWASATNGTELGLKQPSEDAAFPIVHDGRRLDGAGALTFGAGVRLEAAVGPGNAWIMPFAYRGEVNQSLPDLGISPDDAKERHGANLGWNGERLTVLGQVIDASDGPFERSGFFLQPTWDLNERFALSYRYNRLDVDMPAAVSDSRTWDRTQHVLALITTLAEGLLLKTEYYANGEDTGGAEVENDEILLQLELKWP